MLRFARRRGWILADPVELLEPEERPRLRRVAEVEGAEILGVRETLDKAGVDPDQVRRDEVLQRYRRSPSIEAIVGELHMFRDEVERILREAGVDLGGRRSPTT